MSPLSEFTNSRERIFRAKQHHAELRDKWAEFLHDDPYSAHLEVRDDGNCSLSVSCRYDPLPSHFSIILGEFLYQLRASLDACVYGAAMRESGEDPPPKKGELAFPVSISAADFRKHNQQIGKYLRNCWDIIESVQPYTLPDVDDDLRVLEPSYLLDILNKWARIDRHRKLHTVGSWLSDPNTLIEHPPDCELIDLQVCSEGILKSFEPVATFRLRGYEPEMKPEISANPNLLIDIAVDEDPRPCADTDTLPVRLEGMADTVERLVREIESRYMGK